MDGIQEKFYIETYKCKGTNQILIDVSEYGYTAYEEAKQECKRLIKENIGDGKQRYKLFEEQMRAFLMDETTEDTEPVLIPAYRYIYKPAAYYFHPDHGHMTKEQYELKKS